MKVSSEMIKVMVTMIGDGEAVCVLKGHGF
jgi:hypothetical protein